MQIDANSPEYLAQKAAARQIAQSTGFAMQGVAIGASGAVETDITRVLASLEIIEKRLAIAADNVTAFFNRLHGPAPTGGITASAGGIETPPPAIRRVEMALERIGALADELSLTTARLETVA